MRAQIKTRARRNLVKATLSMLVAAVLVALSSPVQATEEGGAEVTVYIGCDASTHLMTISGSIIGVPGQSQLQASYNIGGGTEHSLGIVWTGQLGIGSTNTESINSPYPDAWVNLTIGGYHARKMSKACP